MADPELCYALDGSDWGRLEASGIALSFGAAPAAFTQPNTCAPRLPPPPPRPPSMGPGLHRRVAH